MAQQLRRFLGAGRSRERVTSLHRRDGSAERSRFWSGESRCGQLLRLRREQLLAEHVASNQQSSKQSELASVSTRDSISSILDDHSSCHGENMNLPRVRSPVPAEQDGLLQHFHDLQQVQSQVENEVEAMGVLIFKLGDGAGGCHTACSQLLLECTRHFEKCAKKLRVINKYMESVGIDSLNFNSMLSLEACRHTLSPSQERAHASFNARTRYSLVQQEAPPNRSHALTSGHVKKSSVKATNHRGRTAAVSTPQVHQTLQSLPAFSEQPTESNRQRGKVNSTCSEGEDVHFRVQTVNLPVCGDIPTMFMQQAATSPHLPDYEEDGSEVPFTS